MGLFGDLIKNAVGKVVEKAVAPAVDKIADEAENLICSLLGRQTK